MFSRFFFFLKTAGETIAGLTAWSLLRVARRRRQQVAFIRATLAAPPNKSGNKRIVVALSTLPDRITRLEPVLRCLFEQTRPPDEILLAIPKFSRRLQKPYVIPSTLESIPRLRILRSENDWGPATKFIPALQHELAMGRPETLLMV
ncbi:MAG TPA: hypothetical protein VGF73_11915, partial [Chthoniobacterales bacterium]